MGELYLHNLGDYIQKYGCSVFIETGTGKGTGLSFASAFPFKKLYSIEFVESLFFECVLKFKKDDRVSLINNNSIAGLSSILCENVIKDPCLFWLDAHFPGADFGFNSYDYLKEFKDLHKPLEKELETICSLRPNAKDVFIIDDLQIYEDGGFELLNLEFKKAYGESGIEFIERLFSATHNFTRDYRHQGFLILTPK